MIEDSKKKENKHRLLGFETKSKQSKVDEERRDDSASKIIMDSPKKNKKDSEILSPDKNRAKEKV
jgi:hypothetical protein